MKICIPVSRDEGLRSPVSAHFGTAPSFMIVDSGTGDCRSIPNRDLHHAHGGCQPLLALGDERVDAIVVGGIGAGALSKLRMAGVRVFFASLGTVEAVLAALSQDRLAEVAPEQVCGHAHGGCHE